MPSAARPASSSLGDRPALDGLRALAVLAVVAFHTRVLHVGSLGVTVFFVLSGFLITTLLLEELEERGTLDVPRFLGRRVLRLLPALLLLGGGVVLLHPLGIGAGTDALGLGSALTWWSNWVRALTDHRMGMVGHTWSLAVEAQFYLAWPLLLVLAHRARGVRGVRYLAVALALVSLSLRLLLWNGTGSIDRLYNGTDTAADQLLWGCALATLAPHRRTVPAQVQRVGPYVVAGALLALGAVGLASDHLLATAGYAVASLLSAVLVWGAVVGLRGTAWLALPLPRGIGRVSYGIYLWHFPVIFCLRGWFHTEGQHVVELVSCALWSTAIAWVSYRAVERPLQRRFGVLVRPLQRAAAPAGPAHRPAPR